MLQIDLNGFIAITTTTTITTMVTMQVGMLTDLLSLDVMAMKGAALPFLARQANDEIMVNFEA